MSVRKVTPRYYLKAEIHQIVLQLQNMWWRTPESRGFDFQWGLRFFID
jgi:hypothetical protein